MYLRLWPELPWAYLTLITHSTNYPGSMANLSSKLIFVPVQTL